MFQPLSCSRHLISKPRRFLLGHYSVSDQRRRRCFSFLSRSAWTEVDSVLLSSFAHLPSRELTDHERDRSDEFSSKVQVRFSVVFWIKGVIISFPQDNLFLIKEPGQAVNFLILIVEQSNQQWAPDFNGFFLESVATPQTLMEIGSVDLESSCQGGDNHASHSWKYTTGHVANTNSCVYVTVI